MKLKICTLILLLPSLIQGSEIDPAHPCSIVLEQANKNNIKIDYKKCMDSYNEAINNLKPEDRDKVKKLKFNK